jgi:LysR family hydrogen peroxide-inducible transcriptional activator
MANFTLKQLRYFEALARHGHFGRAAEASAISQPALSVQIKELETTLGLPLFERAARSVRLTPFGETFAKSARSILQSVDDLSDLARAAQTGIAGQMRLGIIPTIAPYLLPRIIRGLNAAFPTLDLDIRETLTQKLIEELNDRRLDAAIVALPVSEATLSEVPLFDEKLVLVRPVAAANTPVPSAEALRHMRLLLLEEGHCFRDQALSFCALRPNGPRAGLDGSSLSTLVQMVGAGMGVTLIPEMAVAVETRSAAVSVAAMDEPQPARTIGMVWRKSNPMGDQFDQIADAIRAAVKTS